MFWLSWENVGHFCHLSPKEDAVGVTGCAQWSGRGRGRGHGGGDVISLKLAPEGLRMVGLEMGVGMGRVVPQ